jgi:creatinine amidohydrolase
MQGLGSACLLYLEGGNVVAENAPGVPTHVELCIADEATFWPWVNWPDLANWPGKDRTLVVVPLAGFSDSGLDAPLDAEETVLMSLLKAASEGRGDLSLLVVPPIRFVLGPVPGCAFAVDPDVACRLVEEIVTSIGLAGFTRITFANASPWTEELCKAVGRDLRIARRLQMFNVNLSALGLDFHPARGGERAKVKAVLASLGGDESLGGTAIMKETAGRLVGLFKEMRDKPALAWNGELPTQTWP